MISGLLVVLGSAWAATPVIVSPTADPSEALARVTELTGLAAGDLDVTRSDGMLPNQPFVLVGGGRADGCEGAPSSLADVRSALDAADASIAYLEYGKALPRLQEAAEALSCLGEPADSAVAARIYYLRGIVSHANGDGVSAEAAFRQAHAYDPGLVWDPDFAPDAVPLFEAAAVAEGAAARFAVVPESDGLFVDGRAQRGAVELLPGAHLVQHGNPLQTLRVFVGAGSTVTMVVPSELPDDLVGWAADPARHEQLVAVIGAARPGSMAYVVSGEAVWRVDAGGVERLGLEPAPSAPIPAARANPRFVSTGLMIGGGAVAVGGGALSFVALQQGTQARDDAKAAETADDWDAWQDADGRYDDARGRLSAARAVAIGGAGLAVGGIVLGVVW